MHGAAIVTKQLIIHRFIRIRRWRRRGSGYRKYRGRDAAEAQKIAVGAGGEGDEAGGRGGIGCRAAKAELTVSHAVDDHIGEPEGGSAGSASRAGSLGC